MMLRTDDKGIAKDLIIDGVRERESTKMVRRIIKKGAVVIDIGANIGYYALLESKLAGSEGMIYAIEPSPENVRALKKNLRINNRKNMRIFELAIGDKQGKAVMNISPHSNLNTFVSQEGREVVGKINVPMTTLDAFLKGKKHPDFIRMDVEGYEYNVLKGMKKTLQAKKPFSFFIEVHFHIMSKSQSSAVLKTLEKNGFETVKVVRSVTVPEMKVMRKSQYDFSHLRIKDILDSEKIMNGTLGAFEIFFRKT